MLFGWCVPEWLSVVAYMGLLVGLGATVIVLICYGQED